MKSSKFLNKILILLYENKERHINSSLSCLDRLLKTLTKTPVIDENNGHLLAEEKAVNRWTE